MWQFYSNAQFGEDLLVTRVQGREVSFSAAVINQLLGTSQDGIFSFGEVQVVPVGGFMDQFFVFDDLSFVGFEVGSLPRSP